MTSDQAEARWNCAFWIQNELTVVGDLTGDPAGATARQEWISDLGLWYDEPTDLADWDSVIGPLAAQIGARFTQTCCQVARTLHTTGVIERSVGRTVPVIVHELELRGDRPADQGRQPARPRRRVHLMGPQWLRHSDSSNTRLHPCHPPTGTIEAHRVR
jgi:hypothetical protein